MAFTISSIVPGKSSFITALLPRGPAAPPA